MKRPPPTRAPHRPAYSSRPQASAKDRIAWRICAFAAGHDSGCLCAKRGHGHCEAVGKVAETVFTWARDDIESGPRLEVPHGR